MEELVRTVGTLHDSSPRLINSLSFLIDDSTYDTVFQTTTGEALILRVYLPPVPLFSSLCRAPSMTLVGITAIHPWLDSKMRLVGHPANQNDDTWRNARVLLGAAVHEVINQLQVNPPQILQITDPGLLQIQKKMELQRDSSNAPKGRNPPNTPQNANTSTSTKPAPQYDMPTIPNNYPTMDSLSRDELQLLLDNDTEFTSFVTKLDIFPEIKQMGNSLLEENATVAKTNLGKESELKSLHEQVSLLQLNLKEKLENFKILEGRQAARYAPEDQQGVLKKLTKAKKVALNDSDECAEQFIESGGNVTLFVKEFLIKRRLYHMRSAKIELLSTASGR